MKQVLYNELDYNEAEDLLEEFYNMRPGSCELVANNEWNNYSNYDFTVEPQLMSEEDLAEVERAAKRTHERAPAQYRSQPYFDAKFVSTADLLNHMCACGKLSAGEYLITVFW